MSSQQSPNVSVDIYVCITCKKEGVPVGQQLHQHLQQQASDYNVQIHAVECFAACKQASTAWLSQPNKWGYLLANLTPAHAADLLAYTNDYAAAENGAPPFATRPEFVRRNTIARTPPAMRLHNKGAV